MLYVRRYSVQKLDAEQRVVSALSRLIEESEIPDEEATDQKENGGLALTIYLPDCNSLTVHVKETSNFRDVIQRTLVTHEKQGILPPLVYNDPGAYELRIHEGDGEPDRDFPALGLEKLLSDFNLDEYCICVIEGRKRASTNLDNLTAQGSTTSRAISAGGGGTANGNGRGTFGALDGAQSTFGLSNFQTSGRPTMSGNTSTLVQSNSAGQLRSSLSYNNLAGMSSNSRGGRDRDDTGNTLGGRQDRTRSYSKQSYDSFQNIVRIFYYFC